MKIKTSLLLAALAPAVMAIVAGGALVFGHRTTQTAQKQAKAIDSVLRSINELNNLAATYLLYHDERPSQQFLAEHDALLARLAAVHLHSAEQEQILDSIGENANSMKSAFAQLVKNFELTEGAPGDMALQRAGARVAGQLHVKGRQAVADGLRLQRAVNDQLTATQNTVSVLVLFLIVSVTAAITGVLLATRRGVAASLATLRAGTQAVGGGNLAHRIGLAERDELGALARSFDEMTARLQMLTVSKNELEQEISERRQVEEALRISEERFELAARGIGAGIWDWDLRTGKVYYSPGWKMLFGYAPHEIGESLEDWSRLLHPDERESILTSQDAFLAGTSSQLRVEYRLRHRDGTYRWIEAHGIVIRDQAGHACRFVGSHGDVTSRKQAEEELRESEKRFRALTLASSAVIYRMNADWSAMHQLQGSGFLADTDRSNPAWLEQYIPHEDQQLVMERVREAVRAKSAFELEHRVRRADGGTGWTNSRAVPLLDGQDQVVEWFGTAHDITERKRAEEALKASLAEKEVLLKEIHHRVKNNMQVMSSLVTLQAERVPDLATRTVLQDVTHRVRSMALVHEKLYQSTDLARIEFADYAQSLLHSLWRAQATAASGIRLALDLEPVPLSVNMAVPCGLVLNELVTNALKHAFVGRDGGEVTVSLHRDAEGQVCLRVRDNGTGLPAGMDWLQTESLGLHLVQILARQLHATVEVTSAPGTEFSVTFPAEK